MPCTPNAAEEARGRVRGGFRPRGGVVAVYSVPPGSQVSGIGGPSTSCRVNVRGPGQGYRAACMRRAATAPYPRERAALGKTGGYGSLARFRFPFAAGPWLPVSGTRGQLQEPAGSGGWRVEVGDPAEALA